MDNANSKQQKHFVLVHSTCFGAWVWYKLKPLLDSAGHKVTAIDLSASGINMSRSLHEIHTIEEYSQQLMELMAKIPTDEKVVLVGHIFGGVSLGLAMEQYPEKISVAVFLAAVMPHPDHPMTLLFEKHAEFCQKDIMLDAQYSTYPGPEGPEIEMNLGPQVMSLNMFPNCSAQDLELAKMLIRPGSLFVQDLSKAKIMFSKEKFGSVKRAFIVLNDDKIFPVAFQNWFVQSSGSGIEVKEIKGSDHMAMLSKPAEVF